MAKVHITNVNVLNNPSDFFTPFKFELTFECIEELKEDLEWRMIYVGSAESEAYDQVLDTIYVGPVPEGRHVFVFEAEAPDCTKIPEDDAVGVTIVLLTCSYRNQEFVRVGYFINNDYADMEMRENPPTKPLFEKLVRNILATKPRVTRFKINWDDGQGNENGQPFDNAANNGENSNMGVDEEENSEDAGYNAVASSMQMPSGSVFNKPPPVDEYDDDSLAMPIVNGVHVLNENSDSLAMEC